MKKKFLVFIGIVVGIFVLGTAAIIGSKCYTKAQNQTQWDERDFTFASLDHDIYISEDSTKTICQEDITGWNPSCGPSPAGWPMAFPFKWEITLCESNQFYFARLIYHEYVMWLTFDYPYVLVKIPKTRTTADWATNTSARYNALWDITRNFEAGWNTPKCIKEPQIYNINGHHVHFANDTYGYEKYVVVHDVEYPW